MRKTLTKTGNSVALVLDQPILKAAGIKAGQAVEVSTNGDVILVTPVRSASRTAKLTEALEWMDKKYAGVFKRLAE